MASNREIVEVLHFVGATDRFIAREFERHFLRLGVRAGIVGAIWAMFVFLAMPTVMELLGGGGVTIAEMRRLIGIAALDPPGYFLLGIVVLVIACAVHADVANRRLPHPEQPALIAAQSGKSVCGAGSAWVTNASKSDTVVCVTAKPTPGATVRRGNVAGAGRAIAAAAGIALFAFLGGLRCVRQLDHPLCRGSRLSRG